MKPVRLFAITLGFGIAHAAEPSPQTETCDQIREQIRSHTGIPARPNTVLLGKVGANKKCRFTSAEAYRAAWGDKPMPPDQAPERRRQKQGEGNP